MNDDEIMEKVLNDPEIKMTLLKIKINRIVSISFSLISLLLALSVLLGLQ